MLITFLSGISALQSVINKCWAGYYIKCENDAIFLQKLTEFSAGAGNLGGIQTSLGGFAEKRLVTLQPSGVGPHGLYILVGSKLYIDLYGLLRTAYGLL